MTPTDSIKILHGFSYIAYPVTLKYSDSKGQVITVTNEELKKIESGMEK